MQLLNNKFAKKGGFTLVELAVVVVIIGVLAAFAVPRFMSSVERSKAAESFNYLTAIQTAQERYHARNGEYAATINDLDAEIAAPAYFTVGTIEVPANHDGFQTGWELTLTRTGASAGYGEYTVVFNQDGYDQANSTIANDVTPLTASN